VCFGKVTITTSVNEGANFYLLVAHGSSDTKTLHVACYEDVMIVMTLFTDILLQRPSLYNDSLSVILYRLFTRRHVLNCCIKKF